MLKTTCQGALLTMGSHLGTLAAARDLGQEGIPIALADHSARTLTGASKYVRAFYHAPDLGDVESFAEWLVDFGQKKPGYFLYPASDDLAWIIAHYQDRLRPYFYLYQPEEQATYTLLNKEKLAHLASHLGIATPKTWFPKIDEDLHALARDLPYPVIVKPKTQIGLSIPFKGIVVRRREDLAPAFETLRDRCPYKTFMTRYDPSLLQPMVQEYIPHAPQTIVSVAGFLDRSGDLQSYRSAIKRFQRPVKVGVGIGFESLLVPEALKERTLRIAREAGYYGVFEVEYVPDPKTGEYLIIDFNPRFYGQMGFEIARDLPLPRLAYAGACGDLGTMQHLIQKSNATLSAATDRDDIGTPTKALMSRALRLLVTTQWLGGKMSWESRQRWLTWAREGSTVDLVHDRSDPMPAKLETWNTIRSFIRYPRGSIRDYFF